MGRMTGKHQLAMESIHLEQDVLKETVGSQDQVLAAYGGFNHISFLPNGEIAVRPVTVGLDRLRDLNSHLMLFYTGIKRTASNVAATYVEGIDDRKRQLRLMKDLVDEGVSIVNGAQDLNAFGELLHEGWQAKRSLSATVSNSSVDEIYDASRSAGALGGKLIGAGGGGFLLLFAPPERQQAIREKLGKLIHVPFMFEFSGSQIIFCDRQEDYSAEERARANQSVAAFRELVDES
jgi:D-glycero-alpha-D-manno-heptose-7-phosphate kinase